MARIHGGLTGDGGGRIDMKPDDGAAGLADTGLPPGQYRTDGFPRFGVGLDRPPPEVPSNPVIEIAGAVTTPFPLLVADLARLARREVTVDFHCVAGWSARNLRWEGVAFETLYRDFIEPSLPADASITHVVFEGLDGYRSIVLIEDALSDDVLIADHLNGVALDGDHGAPVRLVSPSQYGYVSTKHLCRIEVHTSEPKARYHPSWRVQLALRALKPHRRARVWREERHRYIPAGIYRRIVSVLRSLLPALPPPSANPR
jgi:DMSO/TMAO reductase YedYZ molybdopterin-dependent catalytic subunit